jgi:predicted HTH transcriptional regulator
MQPPAHKESKYPSRGTISNAIASGSSPRLRCNYAVALRREQRVINRELYPVLRLSREMIESEFETFLALGHETSAHEFKGPCLRTDRFMFGKVIRGMMGMSNRRDGGLIFIGVREKSVGFDPMGLTSDQLKSWNYDDICAGIAPYAAPGLRFEYEPFIYKGSNVLLLRIQEFEDIPIICRKEFQAVDSATGKSEAILKEGACYVRSRAKPETVSVSTEVDMRDLLDLAVDKAIVRFVARTSRLGFTAPNTDQESFNQEIHDLP